MAQKRPKTHTSVWIMAKNEPYVVLITREKNQNDRSNSFREIGLEGLFKRSLQPRMAQKRPKTHTSLWFTSKNLTHYT